MKILAIDIETSPNIVYTWGLFDQNIGLNQIVETSGVLCFAAKFLGEKRVHFYSVHKHGREAMVQAAHDLLSEADVVMHYNGKRFDIPHLNREFVEAGLTPPEPYKQIDLYLVSRRVFKFQSNRLDHVTQQLGLEGKVQHEGFDLWRRCLAGDETAWKTMERYNRRDVTLLEDLYEILRPWIPNHPNRALYDNRPGTCPKCGGTHLQRRGTERTAVSEYPRFQCQTCGAYFRGTARSRGSSITEIAA